MAVTILKQARRLPTHRRHEYMPTHLRARVLTVTIRGHPTVAAPTVALPTVATPTLYLPWQVMEEKLDVNNVEVAAVKLPPPPPGLDAPVTAACHYVPGHKVNKPQFMPYTKAELEAVLARVTPAPASA